MDLNTQRQMPCNKKIVRDKDYCDLLYAWLQCNSERASINSYERRIEKKKIKWAGIEREFTRIDPEGQETKIMGRKTIAKYFSYLEKEGLVYTIEEEPEYYYLKVFDRENGHLIEYNTLEKLMVTLQKNSLNIYIYLFNRYCANGSQPVIITMKQIKDYLGIASTTTSNNIIITHTIEILQRLGLLKYSMEINEDNQYRYMKFHWVKNKLDGVCGVR